MMTYTDEKINFLRKFPIFRDLSDYEMGPIIDFSQTKTYKPKTIVFMQHEPITNVYFIKKGKLKINRTDYEDKEHIINILQTDNMFRHQGYFRKANYPAHAEIIEKSILINIPIRSFENFLLTPPDVSIKMFRVLGEIIVRSEEHTSELQSRGHLVCRLLLEKKNRKIIITNYNFQQQ